MLVSEVKYLATKIRAFLKQFSPLMTVVRELRKFRISVMYNTNKVIFHLKSIWNMVSKAGQSRQKVLKIAIPVSGICSFDKLERVMEELRVNYVKHKNTLYIPPQPGLISLFGEIVKLYPDNAGFKILRYPENPGEIYSLLDKVVVANYLYMKRISPRLYDFVELYAGETSFKFFVVQHMKGDEPNDKEKISFVEKIRKLVETGELLMDSRKGEESQVVSTIYQGCNSSLLVSKEDKQLYCLDFQNYNMSNPKKLIQNIAIEGRDSLHYGSKRFLRRSKYFYQSIPSIGAHGRRDVTVRWKMIKRLMNEAGVDFDEKLILDIGCNAGMMMSQALADGAWWGLGWDKPAVVEHGQRLLMALGYTRFDLRGVELTRDYSLLNDIQTRFSEMHNDIMIFYLAIRLYFGFISDLSLIPWKVMIYEGHKGETQSDLSKDLSELYKMCSFSIASSTEYNDGDSHARTMAVLIRK